jgi:hypothetical protein
LTLEAPVNLIPSWARFQEPGRQNRRRKVKVQHRTFFESQIRVCLTGHRNHPRRQIDAEGTQSESAGMP